VLQDEIIPMFYERNRYGIPQEWLTQVRGAMQSIVPVYNTHRMVSDYATKYYFPKK
jgi:starch phosphorylase